MDVFTWAEPDWSPWLTLSANFSLSHIVYRYWLSNNELQYKYASLDRLVCSHLEMVSPLHRLFTRQHWQVNFSAVKCPVLHISLSKMFVLKKKVVGYLILFETLKYQYLHRPQISSICFALIFVIKNITTCSVNWDYIFLDNLFEVFYNLTRAAWMQHKFWCFWHIVRLSHLERECRFSPGPSVFWRSVLHRLCPLKKAPCELGKS